MSQVFFFGIAVPLILHVAFLVVVPLEAADELPEPSHIIFLKNLYKTKRSTRALETELHLRRHNRRFGVQFDEHAILSISYRNADVELLSITESPRDSPEVPEVKEQAEPTNQADITPHRAPRSWFWDSKTLLQLDSETMSYTRTELPIGNIKRSYLLWRSVFVLTDLGDLRADYKTQVSECDSQIRLRIYPTSDESRQIFSRMDVYFSKESRELSGFLLLDKENNEMSARVVRIRRWANPAKAPLLIRPMLGNFHEIVLDGSKTP